MNMQPVDSSQIAAVGYDVATRTLAVQFQPRKEAPRGGTVGPGDIYHYADVPEETHAALIGAESVGKFFGANIRGKFQHTKQDPQQQAQNQ